MLARAMRRSTPAYSLKEDCRVVCYFIAKHFDATELFILLYMLISDMVFETFQELELEFI